MVGRGEGVRVAPENLGQKCTVSLACDSEKMETPASDRAALNMI